MFEKKKKESKRKLIKLRKENVFNRLVREKEIKVDKK